jgi:hypothetical protein
MAPFALYIYISTCAHIVGIFYRIVVSALFLYKGNLTCSSILLVNNLDAINGELYGLINSDAGNISVETG